MSLVETKHPDYVDYFPEWQQMRHSARGPTAIKLHRDMYLPMPSGFLSQPDGGQAMYDAYTLRARFPHIIAPTLRGMIGLIHRTEAQIKLPKKLEFLWEKATIDGLPLEAFHRRITGEILLMGRYSILTDVREGNPYFAGYNTESLINWSTNRDFFVLDETGLIRDGFAWRNRKQWRELTFDGSQYIQKEYNEKGVTKTLTPFRRGNNGSLKHIPLVVVTPRDLSLEIIEPVLIGVSRASITMFQLDADYRHQLFMSGQETLFIYGATKKGDVPDHVGAGVTHGLPQGASAQYVGPSGKGIEMHRQAILDSKDDAINAGAALFDQQSGQESGEALRLRYSAQTASLLTIAQTSAQALEASLRNAALFLNLDPEDIVVKPNLRFVDTVMNPTDGKALMDLWLGAAISKLTMYENLQRGEIASAERSFEEEQELIRTGLIDQPTTESDELNEH